MTGVALVLGAAALILVPRRRIRLKILRRPPLRSRLDHRYRTALLVISVTVTAVTVVMIRGTAVTLAAAIVAATITARRRAAVRRRRQGEEVESLVTGLETMVGELGVGAHPATAAGVTASECSGTTATAFLRASGRACLGGAAHEGLRVADSPVSSELAIVAEAWRISDDHGLALTGLLAAARSDMLARIRFRDRTQASLAGARATGTVLACLPVVGVGLGQAMGASPIGVLLGGGLGGTLLVIGSALVCAGLLWTDAITDRVCR